MCCPAFILNLTLFFSFTVQYHVIWCLSDTSLRWCNVGTQISCLLQRGDYENWENACMHTHKHTVLDMKCPSVVQTKADCLCWHSWQQPSTQITQQQAPTSLYADRMSLKVHTHPQSSRDSSCVRRQTDKGETQCKRELQKQKQTETEHAFNQVSLRSVDVKAIRGEGKGVSLKTH